MLPATVSLLFACAAAAQAAWYEPFPAHRVVDNVYYVGSKDLATYLITTPEGHILINPGFPETVELIQKSVESLGFKMGDVKILLNSHAHSDHVAGMALLKERTGGKVYVMKGDDAVVASGGEHQYHYTSRWKPCKVDRVLHDGDEVTLGGVTLVAHLTPGHTRGCTTWTLRTAAKQNEKAHDVVIIGSPNVNPGYRLVDNKDYPEIAADFATTFKVLKVLPCDVFLGAHGSYYGMVEKYAQQKAGSGANPFIDPEGYRRYVAQKEAAFQDTLDAQRKAQQASPQAAAAGRDTSKVFVGYLYGPPRDIDYSLYTHIFHAFIVADEQGNIRPNRTVPSRELTTEAHRAGVKVLPSLGGWGWDKQFAAIVANPEAEDRYVKAVVRIIDDYDYDGVDLDWEYPDTTAEVPGFERLTRRLRREIDAIGERKHRPMVLTMAASANPGTLRWLDREFLLENMDWINVMTYDFTGGHTNYAGHHSPLFASSQQPGTPRSTELTMNYLVHDRGLPPDRLAVGIPLYGRGFAVAEPYASTKDAPKTRLPQGNYANLHKLLHEQGWKRQWNDQTKNPWLLAPDHSAVIGYDDAESVRLKTEWALKQGFRGVFFWQIHADRLPDGTHPLQEASHQAWAKAQRR